MTKRPTDVYMHTVREGLAAAFPDAAVWVGGGWNLWGSPVVMYEVSWADDDKLAGRIELEAGQEYDVHHAADRVKQIVRDYRKANDER